MKRALSIFLVLFTIVIKVPGESIEPSQKVPGGLDSSKIPIFISLGFDDNKFADGPDWIRTELLKGRTNPAGKGNKATYDGAPMRVDFYVIANSDCPYPSQNDPTSADFYAVPVPANRPVTDAWRRAFDAGLGINNHTYTHQYNLSDCQLTTTTGALPSLMQEIGYCSRYLVNVAGIPQSEIYGMRTPYLASSASNNNSYRATRDVGILYDCTNDCGMQGNQQASWAYPYFPGTMDKGWIWWTNIATPGLWQIPNAIYPTTQTGTFSVKGFDSGTQNGWPSGISGEGFFNQMKWAIQWHLKQNRAPLDLGLHSDYYSTTAQNTAGSSASQFKTPLADRRKALTLLLDWLQTIPEARVVTKIDIIRWMRKPVALDDLSRNTELTFRAENGSKNLGGWVSLADANGSTSAIKAGNQAEATVKIVDQKNWKTDGFAGITYPLLSTLTGAHSVRITYQSTLPLHLRLEQNDLKEASYLYGLPSTGTTERTVELPITPDYFMQPRPLDAANEKKLDLAQVKSVSVVATAFDTTLNGSFKVSTLEFFGAGKITELEGVSPITRTPQATINPSRIATTNNKYLSITLASAGVWQIELISPAGRTIQHNRTFRAAGTQIIPVNTNGAGCYLVRISNGTYTQTEVIALR